MSNHNSDIPEYTLSLSTGDWIDAPKSVPIASIDFLYADPPFNTGTTRSSPVNGRRLDRETTAMYADSFGSSADFISWLRPRLVAVIPLLKPTALIAIHIDWRTCHHVRLLLDQLLGEDRFVNHLVWSYGLGGSSPRRFARKHDDILLYCLEPDRYWFEPPLIPATSRRLRGKTKKMTDVLDIPSINNMADERTGYPTQKPLALLDVLVRACCPPGGTVLDPCCGSGTTLVAALRAGRCAIGLDTNPDALRVARGRLATAGPAAVSGRSVPRSPP